MEYAAAEGDRCTAKPQGAHRLPATNSAGNRENAGDASRVSVRQYAVAQLPCSSARSR